jgi:hypothetical protein
MGVELLEVDDDANIVISYNPNYYATLAKFHQDNAYFRLLTGPASSGKTYACAWELLMLAMAQEPAIDKVRYSRALVVRNTHGLLLSATIPSFKSAYGQLLTAPYGKLVMNPQNTYGLINTPLPDGTILHFEITFRSFDSEASARNALGVEPTYVYIDEISEFSESLVTDITRRTGRYPPKKTCRATRPSVIASTNGPTMAHFTYNWATGEKNALFMSMLAEIRKNDPTTSYDAFFSWFEQPPALLPPTYDWTDRAIHPTDWKPNPLAENVENLTDGYGHYYNQLTSSPNKIRAYVLGQYSPLTTGKLVYPMFSRARHVVAEDTIDRRAVRGVYLAFDFGRTPCCAVACVMPDGRIVITDEIITEDCAISTLMVEFLKPLLAQRYNNPQILGATGDPTGGVLSQAVELSPVNVLLAHGVPFEEPPCGNDVDARIEGVRQSLLRLSTQGQPYLTVTDNCEVLVSGFESEYIYKKTHRGMADRPDKSHPISDIQDAVQYLVSMLMELVGARHTRRTRLKPTKWL